jgi:hypothetical protein
MNYSFIIKYFENLVNQIQLNFKNFIIKIIDSIYLEKLLF